MSYKYVSDDEARRRKMYESKTLESTFNSCAEGLGASAAAAASGSLDLFSDMLALPSVIATIITLPTSPLFSAFNPTLTAWKSGSETTLVQMYLTC